jgi:ADP-ribosylglycohydrolase
MTSTYDRILGALFGMATGDALGVPSSFLTPSHIKRVWGWIDTFYPPEEGHIYHAGLKAGEYTDDTEQAFALIHSFKKNCRVDPYDVVMEILNWAERVKDKYCSPLGPSTERALKAIKAGVDITQSGRYGNTNGSAMRIAPVGIIHGLLDSTCQELTQDVYQTCLPTHNTTVCVASAAAIANGVRLAMKGERNLSTIIDGTIEAAKLGECYGYEIASSSVPRKIEFACDLIGKDPDPEHAMTELYSYFGGGDLAADSIPLAIALFALGQGDPRKVNEYCVNFGGDCDTNAAMAGAMAGAYSGYQAVPLAWRETIERVNHVSIADYADDLVSIAPRWTIASPELCAKGKK